MEQMYKVFYFLNTVEQTSTTGYKQRLYAGIIKFHIDQHTLFGLEDEFIEELKKSVPMKHLKLIHMDGCLAQKPDDSIDANNVLAGLMEEYFEYHEMLNNEEPTQ